MNVMSKAKAKDFMRLFLKDVCQALIISDAKIRDQFFTSEHKETFYKDIWKGIGTWSITEPIIKFLIYIGLCHKYKIRPEDLSYDDTKLLDFAIYVDGIDYNLIADIAVEMKWVQFTKSGELTSNSVQQIVDDFVKIKKVANPHKFIMNFAIEDLDVYLNPDALNKQMEDEIDGRLIRMVIPRIIGVEEFETIAEDHNSKKRFVIILWHIDTV